MSTRVTRRRRTSPVGWILPAFVVLVILYLITPILTVVLGSFTDSDYIVLPPRGFSLRWYAAFLFGHEFWAAIRLSLLTAGVAVVMSTLIGVPASYALVRYQFRGRDWVNMATLSPIIIPEMITAIALLQFFAAQGLRPSIWLLFVGHTILTMPYMVRTVTASLRGVNPTIEEAARGLGAHPLRAFFTIVLPLIRPGVFAGAMFVFVISLDVFLVSMFLSPAATLPLDLWWKLRFNSSPIVLSLASLMVGLSTCLTVLIARRVGLESFVGSGRA